MAQKRQIGAALALGVVLTFLLGAGDGTLPAAAPPLTPAQKDKVKERDRLLAQANRLRRAGKLPEAIATCRRMIALEREAFGPLHEEVAQSLQMLARWCE